MLILLFGFFSSRFVLDSVDNNLYLFPSCHGSCWALIQGQCRYKIAFVIAAWRTRLNLPKPDSIWKHSIKLAFFFFFVSFYRSTHMSIALSHRHFDKTTQNNTALGTSFSERLRLLPGTHCSTVLVAALGHRGTCSMSYLWTWGRVEVRRECTLILPLRNKEEGQIRKHSCFRWSWLLGCRTLNFLLQKKKMPKQDPSVLPPFPLPSMLLHLCPSYTTVYLTSTYLFPIFLY